jgi:hypothetical protein
MKVSKEITQKMLIYSIMLVGIAANAFAGPGSGVRNADVIDIDGKPELVAFVKKLKCDETVDGEDFYQIIGKNTLLPEFFSKLGEIDWIFAHDFQKEMKRLKYCVIYGKPGVLKQVWDPAVKGKKNPAEYPAALRLNQLVILDMATIEALKDRYPLEPLLPATVLYLHEVLHSYFYDDTFDCRLDKRACFYFSMSNVEEMFKKILRGTFTTPAGKTPRQHFQHTLRVHGVHYYFPRADRLDPYRDIYEALSLPANELQKRLSRDLEFLNRISNFSVSSVSDVLYDEELQFFNESALKYSLLNAMKGFCRGLNDSDFILYLNQPPVGRMKPSEVCFHHRGELTESRARLLAFHPEVRKILAEAITTLAPRASAQEFGIIFGSNHWAPFGVVEFGPNLPLRFQNVPMDGSMFPLLRLRRIEDEKQVHPVMQLIFDRIIFMTRYDVELSFELSELRTASNFSSDIDLIQKLPELGDSVELFEKNIRAIRAAWKKEFFRQIDLETSALTPDQKNAIKAAIQF